MGDETRAPNDGGSSWRRSTALHGDASSRVYYRLQGPSGQTAIEARYPRGLNEDLNRNIEVLRWLRAAGIRVPEILEIDRAGLRLVVEDFGELDAASVLERTTGARRELMVQRLISPLAVLASLSPDELPGWSPPLEEARLRWELAGFELWFVQYLAGKTPAPDVGRWLDQLAADISSHPSRVCHRDFHLNNLFLLDGEEVGVIDVQDLLIGPDTYDAVSLVFERAFPCLLDEPAVEQWLSGWAVATGAKGDWRERCRRTRLQRALKVMGTFSRLDQSGRPGYRQWISVAARGAVEECRALGAPAGLTGLLLDWCR